MKTSSETESVATRPLDPGEEIDLTEEYPFKPLSDQEPAGTPLALPRTRSSAHTGEGVLPLPPASPRVAERRASAPTQILFREPALFRGPS